MRKTFIAPDSMLARCQPLTFRYNERARLSRYQTTRSSSALSFRGERDSGVRWSVMTNDDHDSSPGTGSSPGRKHFTPPDSSRERWQSHPPQTPQHVPTEPSLPLPHTLSEFVTSSARFELRPGQLQPRRGVPPASREALATPLRLLLQSRQVPRRR